MADITIYLDNNLTLRDTITKLTIFKPLTDKKVVDNTRRMGLRAAKTNITLKPEAQSFLDIVGWSQDDFITTYGQVFGSMSEKSIETHQRFLKEHAIRIYAISGLNWTSDSKNRTRDWEKVATASVVEAALVASYRVELLSSCTIAQSLRKELHDFFYEMTPPWRQMSQEEAMLTLITDKKWIFPDNIYIEIPRDKDKDKDSVAAAARAQRILRSQWQSTASKKSAPDPSKKVTNKKKNLETAETLAADPDDTITPTQRDTPTAATTAATATTTTTATTAATKDNPPHRKSDDIGVLLSSLKAIQKHKLLQCSDPNVPSGSTESIVSFATSIIGHVTLPIASSTPFLTHNPFLRSPILTKPGLNMKTSSLDLRRERGNRLQTSTCPPSRSLTLIYRRTPFLPSIVTRLVSLYPPFHLSNIPHLARLWTLGTRRSTEIQRHPPHWSLHQIQGTYTSLPSHFASISHRFPSHRTILKTPHVRLHTPSYHPSPTLPPTFYRRIYHIQSYMILRPRP